MGTKTTRSQPISSHPLFPAIVALWFGALFGLGSLAVRVSLVESLVISSHIDTIVPQAAPPLGMTARILLALAMAVIGGLIGGRIGRWIAQPRNQARERQRGAQPARTAKPAMTRRQEADFAPIAQADADADDYDADADDYDADAEVAAPAVAAPAGRRRALAVEESMVRPDYLHDAAPLPGSQPQILDVTEFDFLEADAAHQPISADHAELDLGAYPSEEMAQTTPPPMPLPVEPAPVAPAFIEGGAGESFAMPAIDAADPHEAEEESSELVELRNNAKQPAIETGPDFDSAPGLQPRPFDAAGASAPSATQTPFAAPAVEATVPSLAATGAPARPFAAPATAGSAPDAAAPQFEAPVEPAVAAKPFAAPAQSEVAAQPFAAPAQPAATERPFTAVEAPSTAAQPFAAPEAPAAVARPFAAPTPQVSVPADGEPLFEAEPAAIPQAFSPPPQAAPVECPLPQLELPRLGRRLEPFNPEPVATFVPQIAAVTPVEEPVEEPEPMESAMSPHAQPAAPLPFQQSDAAPVSRIASADLDELSPVELVERMALSLQRRRARKSASNSATEPVASAAMLAAVEPAPQATRPVDPTPPANLLASDASTTPAATQAAHAAPVGLALPAALRPIDFTEYEDDDDGQGFAPARSISMPAPAPEPVADIASATPVTAPFAPLSPLEAEADHGLPAEAEAEGEEEGVAEGSYSSLLDIGRPAEQRQQFIRIEEPEDQTDAIEPVVIFPGRSARAETRFDPLAQVAPEPLPAIPAMNQAEGQPQLRRFDTPLPQPVAASAIPQRDPAETERVLRSALATLQRMSGAA